jgi:hypothetical protein
MAFFPALAPNGGDLRPEETLPLELTAWYCERNARFGHARFGQIYFNK